MARDPYGKTAQATFTDRGAEAHLLTKSATLLNAVREGWPGTRGQLDAALLKNQKLWVVLTSKCNDEDHPLPRELKQNLASLAVFIFRRTTALMADRDPDPAGLDVLIDINRTIASGLVESPGPVADSVAPETPRASNPLDLNA